MEFGSFWQKAKGKSEELEPKYGLMLKPWKVATESRKSTEISVAFRACVAIILLITMHACSADPETEDPFREFITQSYSQIPSYSEVHPGAEKIYMAGGLVAPKNSEILIQMDRADYTIKVLGPDGDILNTAGGQGRGPGELGDYARLYYDENQKLYVVDPRNNRIHVFQILDDDLELLETKMYQYPATYHLSSVFITEAGYFGLFTQSENFFTPENRYLLYSLDQNFEMKEKLLELPGEQRTRYEYPDFTFYLPNIFAEKTLWDMDGDWFYYMSSHTPIINRYHLPTGEKETLDFLQIPVREHHSEIIPLMIEFYEPGDYEADIDQLSSVLYENDSLPMFIGFSAAQNRLFIQTYFTPGDQGIILMADPETEEVRYFEAPFGLSSFNLRNNTLYGVDYRTDSGAYELMRVRLEGDINVIATNDEN